MIKFIQTHQEFISNQLLKITATSWIGWTFLKSMSEICALILPITGVMSFLVLIIINYSKIITGLNDILKSIKNTFRK